MLDTGTPERLNYYINMQRKKENTENDNKSKFCYCFELVFITCVYAMSNYVWGCKIRPWSADAQETNLASSRTLLETPGPSTDHGLTVS